MLNYFLVALGSAVGGVTRYWASGIVANRIGQSFPWDTLFVNITGSFVIGFLATMTEPEGRWLIGPHARNLFMIGFCGGYTTFSSFSLQTLNLLQEREWLYAFGNAILSLALCLVSVWLGHALAQMLNPNRGV
jgi:fluoride exporter